MLCDINVFTVYTAMTMAIAAVVATAAAVAPAATACAFTVHELCIFSLSQSIELMLANKVRKKTTKNAKLKKIRIAI